jgi:hypothetical protein
MPTDRLPRSVRRLAVFLVVVAIAAVGVDITTNALDAWMPNVAVGAISIALTITVIERLIRGAEIERLRPRIDQAYADVYGALVHLVFGAEMSNDEGWLPSVEGFIPDYADPNRLDEATKSAIAGLRDSLQEIRANHVDVLDVTVIVAIDRVLRVSGDLIRNAFDPPADAEIDVATYFATSVLALIDALKLIDPAPFADIPIDSGHSKKSQLR